MDHNKTNRTAISTKAEYYDLGSFERQTTTDSEDAQTWFNRGLVWSYAFNHEEAVECFEQAILHDPTCAMAYWGLVYASGPNYNKPWEVFDDVERESSLNRMRHAAVQATANASKASPVENALIQAVQFRCPSENVGLDFSIWNRDYADAMKSVYREFPKDVDVATLYADALMNLTPWQMWDLSTGEPASGAHTLEVKKILDTALARYGGLEHPGLLHLYIHLNEMGPKPEDALAIADHLRGLVPDAGHLNHMPTHLDLLCGDYHRAIVSNSDAIHADEKFVARAGPLNFYTLYRSHNYHFRIYAAMFAGQSKIAIETAMQLEASLSEELLSVKSPPMADWLEGFLTTRIHVLVRFGLWQDIIDLKLPVDSELHCVTTAMIHYGKGIAFAITGKTSEAKAERDMFHEALKVVPPSRTLFNNTCLDILTVANVMLDGEIEYRRGNIDAGLAHLLQAIKLDDALPYDEPWGWMQPTRHAYGALLLEQGRAERAAEVYRADLGLDNTLARALRHPNNIWALHGYHECLVKLGRTDEAQLIEPQLKSALAMADVPIKSSCFCRLRTSFQENVSSCCES